VASGGSVEAPSPATPINMLEDLKLNKKPTRGFLPWRGLRSLVDDNATAGANTIGQVSTSSTPPTDIQVVSESCDWCLMESPWTRGDDDFDHDDDIVENSHDSRNGAPSPRKSRKGIDKDKSTAIKLGPKAL
jgi:hypothetical protein